MRRVVERVGGALMMPFMMTFVLTYMPVLPASLMVGSAAGVACSAVGLAAHVRSAAVFGLSVSWKAVLGGPALHALIATGESGEIFQPGGAICAAGLVTGTASLGFRLGGIVGSGANAVGKGVAATIRQKRP